MQLQSMDYLCCPGCHGKLQLTIEKQREAEVTQGELQCLACNRRFEIKNGLPNLIFPETLEGSDLDSERWHDQHAQQFDQANRRWLLHLGIWEFGLWETRARRQLVDKLVLKKNASVVETGAGTGSNLSIIANYLGKEHRLHGLDISSGILKVARRKMETKGIRVELVQGNASYLPYRSAKFDALLHVGGLNRFGAKKRAIEEMHRVAKPGAKIVICDEGLAPGKEKTWLGRRILKREPVMFTAKPPVDLIPDDVEDLRVHWIWQGTFWVIEFRKQ